MIFVVMHRERPELTDGSGVHRGTFQVEVERRVVARFSIRYGGISGGEGCKSRQ